VQPSKVGEVLDAYAGACTFLSRLFLQPVDQSLITALRDGPVLADWPLEADEDTVRGLQALRAGTTTPLDVLVVDHRDLFEGPDHVLACPYESVYLSDEHLTFEKQTLRSVAIVTEVAQPHQIAKAQRIRVGHVLCGCLLERDAGEPSLAEQKH